MYKIIIFSGIVLLLLCHYVNADEIFTHDGRRFQGIISEEGSDYFIIKTNEGTVILNKSDVLHIEQQADSKEYGREKRNAIERIIDFFKQLPKNNWHTLRVFFLRIHTRIFSFLEKNQLYRYCADKKMVQKFRRDNYKFYYFAVYMALFITITGIFAIVKGMILGILRRFFGVKRRY